MYMFAISTIPTVADFYILIPIVVIIALLVMIIKDKK